MDTGGCCPRQHRLCSSRRRTAKNENRSSCRRTHDPPLTFDSGKGTIQFPEYVALTRDALALLGLITSLETACRTFVTTDLLYLKFVEARQRHVFDRDVAMSGSPTNSPLQSTQRNLGTHTLHRFCEGHRHRLTSKPA